MVVKLLSERTLEDFYKNGGYIEFEIDCKDIAEDFQPDSNEYPIGEKFELPPSNCIYDTREGLIEANLYCKNWNKILINCYSARGNVNYTLLSTGKIKAVCYIPPKRNK